MGAFIDQVGKNNQLQDRILTERQKEQKRKELEKRQKLAERQEIQFKKDILTDCLEILNEKQTEFYEIEGSSAFQTLNKLENRNKIINDILFIYKSETATKPLLAEINKKLQTNYLKNNKFLKSIYSLSEEAEEAETEENSEETEEAEEISTFGLKLLELLGWLILLPILVIYKLIKN